MAVAGSRPTPDRGFGFPEDRLTPALIGRTLSRFRVEERVGEGGMGTVYRAVDVRLNRAVALKVLPEDLVCDADRLARLEREARAHEAMIHRG